MTDTNETIQPNRQGLDCMDLRPCLLVAVNVSRSGGQHYTREDEEKLDATKDGEVRTKWTTKKIIDNEEEFNEAASLQSRCKRDATKLGRHTPVGIVVAADKRDQVQQYRDEWRDIFRAFNNAVETVRVDFSCMVFRITGDNVQELEAVLDELRDGLEELERAYQSADPGTIRDIVKRMNGFADILPERVATKMELAVKAAKKRANAISKAETRMDRIRTKINKELGEEVTPEQLQERLQQLSTQALTDDIRERTRRFTRLNAEVMAAADKLEEAKQQINAAPIRVARFAVQRPVAQSEISSDEAAKLQGLRLAGQVAGAANASSPR